MPMNKRQRVLKKRNPMVLELLKFRSTTVPSATVKEAKKDGWSRNAKHKAVRTSGDHEPVCFDRRFR